MPIFSQISNMGIVERLDIRDSIDKYLETRGTSTIEQIARGTKIESQKILYVLHHENSSYIVSEFSDEIFACTLEQFLALNKRGFSQ